MRPLLIIGGGFVGATAAAELLAQAPAGTAITLVNGGGLLGRGLAYGTNSAEHLLNVPAARMSWHAERPNDFVDWLAAKQLPHEPGDFVPRLHYGTYLAERLQQAIASRPDLHWQQLQEQVLALHTDGQGGWTAQLTGGRSLQASAALLALGNFAPACPHPDLARLPADRYVDDPWNADALRALPADAPLAIIGSGLTMLDLLASLHATGHRGSIFVLSRRGLLPQAHRRNELPPPAWQAPDDWLNDVPLNLLHAARQVRHAAAAARRDGHDWRDIWVALRARTPALWQSLPHREKAQFLRHLQVLWDVHRHRAAPQALVPLQQAMEQGRLQLAAGRLVSAAPEADAVRLSWRHRHSGDLRRCEVLRVFNCTGPSNRITDDRSPLFAALQREGRLQPCPLGLGVAVDQGYRLLDAAGRPQQGLFYAGPMLKSQHWEATAVPELRAHARRAAITLLAQSHLA